MAIRPEEVRVVPFADYFEPSSRKRDKREELIELLARQEEQRERRIKLTLAQIVEEDKRKQRELAKLVDAFLNSESGSVHSESVDTPTTEAGETLAHKHEGREETPSKSECATLLKALSLLKQRKSTI